MANEGEAGSLKEIEGRIAALEAQVAAGGQAEGEGAEGGQEPGLMQAFLQGALVANALSQATAGAQQPVGTGGGAAPAFLSIIGCSGGWNPTRYDSFFWCRSRFMCNPQSISCLC